jgi:hypothetical protein
MKVSDISEKILQKAIRHIASTQDGEGAWSRLKGEFPAEAEPTSWATKVLSMSKMAPGMAKKGIGFILRDQKPNGSWNDNTAHTGFAIMALQGAEGSDKAVNRAVSYLRTVQHEEGGFQRNAGVGEPSTLHAAIVLFAMRETGYGMGDPMVKKALSWLAGCRNDDGGYGVSRGTPSVGFGTARAVKAFRMHGIPVVERSVRKGIMWLLATQKESGGFSMTPSFPEDPEITAYALTAINGIDEYEEQMQKAVRYLEKVQEEDGSFASYAPIQFDGVVKKNTQTACFVAWALLEAKYLRA